jgi:hypothetical protein
MSIGIEPSVKVQDAVRDCVAERGVTHAAEYLGIGREATARIVAGLGVRRGTLALVEKALKLSPAR